METNVSFFKLSTVFFIRKLNRKYPSACSGVDLADQFNSFFNNKIRVIREGLPQLTIDAAYSAKYSIYIVSM